MPRARRIEYHGLLVLLAIGMCLLAGANHLLMVYVAMEAMSLLAYLITGFDERGQRSAEAGLKYVLYGGVASAVMLFGMSMLYGLFGDLSFDSLRQAISATPMVWAPGSGTHSRGGRPLAPQSWIALVSLAFVLTGFGFKIAAVPFHMWCPDVYEGAPTPFAALLSVGPKAVGFAVLLRFGLSFLPPGVTLDDAAVASRALPWMVLLGIMATLTMTLGNFAAIMQNNLKRLLAYSSIAHAGYLLMGAVAGGKAGYSAVVVYLAVYLMMNMGAFAVVAAVDKSTGSEDISAFRGLGKRAPVLALTMAVFLFSLTGLPPTAGFVGKLYLFAALLKVGGSFNVTLALIGVANSVVSLYFYARVLKAMYFEGHEASAEPSMANAFGSAGLVAVTLAVPTLVLGLFWDPLAYFANWSATLY